MVWLEMEGCIMNDKESAIYATGYWNGIAYKRMRELTDEEIEELANKYLYVLNDVPYTNDIKDFARAILKLASEK